MTEATTTLTRAAWLISASSFAYLANRDALSPRSRLAYQVLANIFCVAAALTRLNAIFCLIPLLLYANRGVGLRKNMVTCLIVLLAIPGIYRAQNAILGITPMHTGDSIKTFHLLGLSYYQQRNLIPGQWNEEQSRKIVQSCYSPIQWDTASAWGQCKFIHDGLVEQKMWGSGNFSRSWLSEILSQPHVFFSMLVPTFKKSMFDPNSRPMLYNSDPNWVVADNPPRATTKIATEYILSDFNDTLGRPWFFGLLSALATVLLLRLRLHASNEGRMALAVLVCGQVYLLTFFVFNVSAEFRYFYWCGFSAYTGSLLVLMGAITRRWRNQNCANADNLNLATRTSALGVASLVVTLIGFPYISETSGRTITLTALDSRPVKVLGIHNSATPSWMLEAFQGDIRRTNWDNFGSFFKSTNPGGQLVARIDMLRETVDIVLETGPELGRLAIDEPGAHLEIDTHTDSPGSQIVLLAPPEETSHTTTMVRSFLNLGSALLSLLGVSLLFRRASIKSA
jgi:hypothetical protein